MNPLFWLAPWIGITNAIQADGWNYNPWTEWFEKMFDGWFSLFHVDMNYGGEPKIEREITKRVASPGRQVGIIIDALDAISKDAKGPEIDRLRNLKAEIEAIKRAQPRQHVLPSV